MIDLARSRGHVERALQVAREHTAAAAAALEALPREPVAEVLQSLGEYSIGRVEAARQ